MGHSQSQDVRRQSPMIPMRVLIERQVKTSQKGPLHLVRRVATLLMLREKRTHLLRKRKIEAGHVHYLFLNPLKRKRAIAASLHLNHHLRKSLRKRNPIPARIATLVMMTEE